MFMGSERECFMGRKTLDKMSINDKANFLIIIDMIF